MDPGPPRAPPKRRGRVVRDAARRRPVGARVGAPDRRRRLCRHLDRHHRGQGRGAAAAGAADQALPVPEIEKIVRDYLMREPEVIYEAIQELQKRQQAAEAARQQTTIAERADEIFRHPEDPIAGDPSGDVTLVEFFDYRCGYCRSMAGDLRTLVDADDQAPLRLQGAAGARAGFGRRRPRRPWRRRSSTTTSTTTSTSP